MTTFETYKRDHECWECGRPPSWEEYQDYLDEERAEEARRAALTPEERAAEDARRESYRIVADPITRDILRELRPTAIMRPFLRMTR